MQENWIRMTKAGEEKLVHPGNVNNHKRFGWEVAPAADAPKAEAPLVLAVSTETAETNGSPEGVAALERFARTLESARKKPAGATAKLFEQLGVSIADPAGPAEPWPPHVLMAQAIDALVKMDDEIQRNVALVGLFGKSGSYVNEFVVERRQAMSEEH